MSIFTMLSLIASSSLHLALFHKLYAITRMLQDKRQLIFNHEGHGATEAQPE